MVKHTILDYTEIEIPWSSSGDIFLRMSYYCIAKKKKKKACSYSHIMYVWLFIFLFVGGKLFTEEAGAGLLSKYYH